MEKTITFYNSEKTLSEAISKFSEYLKQFTFKAQVSEIYADGEYFTADIAGNPDYLVLSFELVGSELCVREHSDKSEGDYGFDARDYRMSFEYFAEKVYAIHSLEKFWVAFEHFIEKYNSAAKEKDVEIEYFIKKLN